MTVTTEGRLEVPGAFDDLLAVVRRAGCGVDRRDVQDAFIAGVRGRHARSWTRRRGLGLGERRAGLEDLLRTKAGRVRLADVSVCLRIDVGMVRETLTTLAPPPGRRSCLPVWPVLAGLVLDVGPAWGDRSAVLWAWWAVAHACPRPVLADLYRTAGPGAPDGWEPPAGCADADRWWADARSWSAAGFGGAQAAVLRVLPEGDPRRPGPEALAVMAALRGCDG